MSVRRPESGDGLVERLWARREARRCTSLPARFFERFGLADPWSEATGSWGRQARGLEARLWSRLGAGLLLGGGFLQALEPAAWLWAWHGVRMGAAWPGLLMDLVFLASPVAFEPEARPARRTRRARRVVLTPPEAPEARSPAVARPPGAPRPGPVPPEAARPGPVPPEAARPGPVPSEGVRPAPVPSEGVRPGPVPSEGVRPGPVPPKVSLRAPSAAPLRAPSAAPLRAPSAAPLRALPGEAARAPRRGMAAAMGRLLDAPATSSTVRRALGVPEPSAVALPPSRPAALSWAEARAAREAEAPVRAFPAIAPFPERRAGPPSAHRELRPVLSGSPLVVFLRSLGEAPPPVPRPHTPARTPPGAVVRGPEAILPAPSLPQDRAGSRTAPAGALGRPLDAPEGARPAVAPEPRPPSSTGPSDAVARPVRPGRRPVVAPGRAVESPTAPAPLGPRAPARLLHPEEASSPAPSRPAPTSGSAPELPSVPLEPVSAPASVHAAARLLATPAVPAPAPFASTRPRLGRDRPGPLPGPLRRAAVRIEATGAVAPSGPTPAPSPLDAAVGREPMHLAPAMAFLTEPATPEPGRPAEGAARVLRRGEARVGRSLVPHPAIRSKAPAVRISASPVVLPHLQPAVPGVPWRAPRVAVPPGPLPEGEKDLAGQGEPIPPTRAPRGLDRLVLGAPAARREAPEPLPETRPGLAWEAVRRGAPEAPTLPVHPAPERAVSERPGEPPSRRTAERLPPGAVDRIEPVALRDVGVRPARVLPDEALRGLILPPGAPEEPVAPADGRAPPRAARVPALLRAVARGAAPPGSGRTAEPGLPPRGAPRAPPGAASRAAPAAASRAASAGPDRRPPVPPEPVALRTEPPARAPREPHLLRASGRRDRPLPHLTPTAEWATGGAPAAPGQVPATVWMQGRDVLPRTEGRPPLPGTRGPFAVPVPPDVPPPVLLEPAAMEPERPQGPTRPPATRLLGRSAGRPLGAARADRRGPARSARSTEIADVRDLPELARALAGAPSPDHVLRLLLSTTEALGAHGPLPAPLLKVVERVREAALAAPGRPTPVAEAPRASRDVAPRPSPATVHRHRARVDRISRLVRRLQELIHLVEVDGRLAAARAQVRLAEDSAAARAEAAPTRAASGSETGPSPDVDALTQEILSMVSREVALQRERRMGEGPEEGFPFPSW